MSWSVVQADAIEFLRAQPEGSVDLVFGSPPYCDARTYGIDAVYGCQEWVDWMLRVTEAAIHASKGLVLWVASGVQREKVYWPACEGLMWEWWKRGNHLWRPCIWWKVDNDDGGTGIPGSGGKQWLRNDWEYVMAFKREGWLPWADPLVMGHEPVYNRVGGEMSNRTADGRRINEAAQAGMTDPWDNHGRGNNVGGRTRDGRKNLGTKVKRGSDEDPWGTGGHNGLGGRKKDGTKNSRKPPKTMDAPAGTNGDGTRKENTSRPMPKIANPGNCVIVKARVGGGHMGSKLCHDNEAPFPEALAEFFVRSFCPPDGLVCDPFTGSGTTAAVAVRHGRNFTGCDLRQSQVDLATRGISEVTPTLFSQE